MKLWIYFETILICVVSRALAQKSVHVVWLAPLTSHPHSNFPYSASTSVAAFALGLETIKNDSILPNHVINVTYIDTHCDSKQTLGKLVDLLFQHEVDLVIGPPCSEVLQPIGELMSYRDTPIMNWVSNGQNVPFKSNQKSVLTTYFRTVAPVTALSGMLIQFILDANWKRFVIISGDSWEHIAGASAVAESIHMQQETGFRLVHHYERIRKNINDTEILAMYRSITHESRIIILVIPLNQLRRYMLLAHAMKMTGGDYQFLYTDTEQFAGVDKYAMLNSDMLWRKGDENDSKARQAFGNVLYFGFGHNITSTSEWRDSAMQAYNNVFGGRLDIPAPAEPDDLSGYLHDTIIYYARLLNATLSRNLTGSGTEMLKLCDRVFFQGLTGNVLLGKIGDRWPSFYLYDMNEVNNFHEVAHMRYVMNADRTGKTLDHNFTKIIWGDGRDSDEPYYPPDAPACGFYNEFCMETETDDSNDSWEISVGVQ